MPTYQYVCTACGDPLEVVQKFSDDALTECPACSGRLRKIFSPAAIVFRGSGFYRTDSRSGSGAAGGSKKDDSKKDGSKVDAAKSDAAKSDGTSSTKTETKSDSSSSSSSTTGTSKGGSSPEKVA